MAYRGMHPTTGRALEDSQHLAQSVATILTTPVGSRLMRRDFGSLLPELIDQPINRATIARLNAATAMALMRWEPRIQLSRVLITLGGDAGQVTVDISGTRTDGPLKARSVELSLNLNLGIRA